jgi:outer membrane lipoprotein-sorting protein
MKKFLTSSLFALLFITSGFVITAKSQVLNEVLNRIEQRRKAIHSLSADIQMGKYNPSLDEWTNSKGKFILIAESNDIKQGLFRLDWSEPRQEIIAIVKGKYYAYTPSQKTAYVGEASAKKAEEKGGGVFAFMKMSKAQLQANYDAKLLGTETLSGGVAAFHLQFTPKKAGSVKSADLWVDKDGMIHQMKSTPASGDESNYRLTNIQDNPHLDTSQFVINLPKDVKILNS